MRTLLAESFTERDVTRLRRMVAEKAAQAGLLGSRRDDFVLAVHESVVNVVEHAGGHGFLRLWTVDGVVCSETIDHGSGIPDAYISPDHRPSERADFGRGIFLIRHLADEADFDTGPQGTTVRLTMRLPRRYTRRDMRTIKGSAPGVGRFA